MMRAKKRRKRKSSSSVQKRTLAQSIGSDSTDEDLQPMELNAPEAGSSARQLRRRVAGKITTLVFDGPPARVEEEEEPETSNESFEVDLVDSSVDLLPDIDYWDKEERHACLESTEEERKKGKSKQKRTLSEEAEPEEYAT